MAGTVKVTFIGDSANLKKHLKEVVRETDKSNSAFGRLGGAGSKMGSMLGAITPSLRTVAIGIAGMTAGAVVFGKKSVDAYNASLEAQTKLSTNLLNVKGNTLDNVKAIQKMATALQKKGVIEDDAIIAGASMLATYGLQGKTIEKVTPKIADMVAQQKGTKATAEDMVKANQLVGKVLTGNVGALTRYGVTLSETQKKQLKNGNEAERAALLVEVLGQNYGNVNEALAKTPEGQMTILKNRFGDLQESIGQVLIKALVPMMGFVMDKVIPGLEKIWGNLQEPLRNIWDWITNKLWPAFVSILPTIMEVGRVVGSLLVSAFKAIGTIIAWLMPHISTLVEAFKKAWPDIKAGLEDAYQRVIKPVFAAIVKAVQLVWRIFQDAWPAIQTVLKVAGIIIGAVLFGIYKLIANVLVPVITFLVEAMSKAWTVISAVINAAWAVIKPIWDLLYAIIANVIIPVIQLLWAIVSPIFILLGAAIKFMWENVIKPALDPLASIWKTIADAASKAWDWIDKNIISKVTGWINKIGDFIDSVKDAINKVLELIGVNEQASNPSKADTKKAFDGMKAQVRAEQAGGHFRGHQDKKTGKIINDPPGKWWDAQQNKYVNLALGGKVTAGMPYRVGEGGGPEMFVPSENGNIINARDTRGMGASYNVTMNVSKAEFTERDLITALKRFESLHAA